MPWGVCEEDAPGLSETVELALLVLGGVGSALRVDEKEIEGVLVAEGENEVLLETVDRAVQLVVAVRLPLPLAVPVADCVAGLDGDAVTVPVPEPVSDALPLAVLVPLPETPMVGEGVGVVVIAAVPEAVREGVGSTDGVTVRVPVRVALEDSDVLILAADDGDAVGSAVLVRVRVGDGVLDDVRVGVGDCEGQARGCWPPVEVPYTFRDTVALSQ